MTPKKEKRSGKQNWATEALNCDADPTLKKGKGGGEGLVRESLR